MVRSIGFVGNSALNENDGGMEGDSSPLIPPGFGYDDYEREDGFCGVYGFGANCKRMRMMSSNQQTVTPPNPPVDSSPLGLTLRKTPSFLDLIEMKLSQTRKVSPMQHFYSKKAKEDFAAQPISEKLKASNFSVLALRIGSWERVSRYDGDLVGKCYYAKRKLVWEVLDSGLKSKIEIQWSDISGIRANFRENEPGILEVELNHAPQFSRETNPQPRKHTLWQATSDFTGGQALIYRRHYLQLPQGALEKHYEKLLQYDSRLYELSQSPFPTINSPYFYSCGGPEFPPVFDRTFKSGYPSRFPLHGIAGPVGVPLQQVQKFKPPTRAIGANDSTSPCSVIDYAPIEAHCAREHTKHQKALFWGEGFRTQVNIGNVNGNQIEELPSIASAHQTIRRQFSSNLCSSISSNDWDLNKIATHLLNDPVATGCSDDIKILEKVKSMYSLLDASSNSETVAESISMKQEEYSEEMSVTDWVKLESSKPSDDDGGHPFPNPLNWWPPTNPNENSSIHLPRILSYPYLFLDQMRDDPDAYDHIHINEE
ncbi:uncharacterized protein LOC131225594 [Magnolia sinica]|uniref:uncharacterized protein LOC131225594 n=1 Tax=Magnolia sinica TaxID=86752 RepID=UPI00265A5B01|nr:uncharacterized protein LOC131225594 [Magnolia sinica]